MTPNSLPNEIQGPLVSVIVPVYNSARTLGECLKSVLQQTYDRWELIIVDSDSKDDSKRIATRFRSMHPDRIWFYNISSRFQAAKRNFAVAHSHGVRIFLHDSDMYLSPNVLEVCANSCHRDWDALGIPVRFIVPKDYLRTSIFYSVNNPTVGVIDLPNFLKRSVWSELGGLDDGLSYVEDLDFFIRFQRAGYKMKSVSSTFSVHDQENSLASMLYRTLHYSRGLRKLAKKWSASRGETRDWWRDGMIAMARAIIDHPIYSPGIICATSVRLLTLLMNRY